MRKRGNCFRFTETVSVEQEVDIDIPVEDILKAFVGEFDFEAALEVFESLSNPGAAFDSVEYKSWQLMHKTKLILQGG